MTFADEAEPTTDDPGPSRADRLAARVLRGPLSALLAAMVVVQVATWAPHYLTWPWYADHDVFATAALSWGAGLRPYRDVLGNNFPGTTYLFWLAGKTCGWGRTAPFYAIDAALVVGFGVILVAWSRRRFGTRLPGWVGYASFLGYYLSLDYSQAAQRDWQGPCFAVVGILAAEAWPGRIGRFVSAVGFALALTIRPQPVVFFPALVSAVVLNDLRDDRSGRRVFAVAAGWVAVFVGALAVLYAPIVLSGLGRDFLRSIREAGYGGRYNQVTAGSFAEEFALQLLSMKVLVVPAATLLFFGRAGGPSRRSAVTWLIGFGCVLMYKPMSPIPHAYLTHPLMVVWSVNVAVLCGVVLDSERLGAVARLTVVLLALGLEATPKPRFSNPRGSVEAIATLRRGVEPGPSPIGYVTNPLAQLAARYPWDDYRRLLEYLRTEVPRDVRVANALKAVPAVNGPTAHLSAFPAESVAWLRIVRPGDTARFAEALESARDSVVVWSPGERESDPNFSLGELEAVIRQSYEPEARFGAIEVWRRKRPEPTGR